MRCTGASTVKIVVHEQLQNLLVHKGVVMAEKGTCQLWGPVCLLAICSSDAVLVDPVIVGLTDLPGITLLLCITHGSKVTLRKGTFASCGVTTIGIYNTDTSVLVDQCSVQGNSGDAGAGIFHDEGTLRVQSSTFKQNKVPSTSSDHAGGAIYVADGTVAIVDSSFHSNEAYNGGAVAAVKRAAVSIQGSRFTANRASWSGGALHAEGNAKFDILPAAKQGPGVWMRVTGAFGLSRGAHIWDP
jgi:hypothetical protein